MSTATVIPNRPPDHQQHSVSAEAAATGPVEGPLFPDLMRLRNRVRFYKDANQLDTAAFWADKVVSLSGGEARDVYVFANILYLSGQYQRSVHLIKSHGIDKKYLICRLLAAQCLFASKEYQESLNLLDQSEAKLEPAPSDSNSQPVTMQQVEACIKLLKGRIYEALDNRIPASDLYHQALLCDVYNYQAFNSIIQHHMLTATEERDLLQSLPWNKYPAEDVQVVKSLYDNLLKKYDKPSAGTLAPLLAQLGSNYDMLVCLAERHYYNCNFHSAYKITTYVLKCDAYNSSCLPLHVAVLVELNKFNELFYLAHKLVDLYPTKAVSWFAVGCYYYIGGKQDQARRYLSKATSLSRQFGAAWLAYGHSFAAENEHDQAMAAYFTASQIMRGCHLPKLYIGLEYGLTNNSKLAERFFSQAQQMSPDDPFVLHEMGVIAFHSKEYETAEGHFLAALQKLQAANTGTGGKQQQHMQVAVKWEPLLNNLGHVSRKLKKYEDSILYHRQSLVLEPRCTSTLSALGYVYALKGDFHQSITYFHKALALRKDDTFSTTMLASSLEHIISDYAPIPGVPDVLPPHTYDKPLHMPQSTAIASNRDSEYNASYDMEDSMTVTLPELPELRSNYSYELALTLRGEQSERQRQSAASTALVSQPLTTADTNRSAAVQSAGQQRPAITSASSGVSFILAAAESLSRQQSAADMSIEEADMEDD